MKNLTLPLLITAMIILIAAGLPFTGAWHAEDMHTLPGADHEEPRNVILILIDDLGYGDLGVHGNPVLKTPNLDHLHSESIRFTNFAVSPSCSATRAAFLTGRHEFKSGVVHTLTPMCNMDLQATTIAQLFKNKGFSTGIFGKWHLGKQGGYDPWNRGFDQTVTQVTSDTHTDEFNPRLLKNRVEKKYQGYRTDIFFDEAMAFIEHNQDRPFFCYLPTYSPHDPLVVADEYSDPYQGIEGVNAKFSGMVANVDENVGRLVARLKSLNLDSSTLLIVMNDNGGTYGVDTWNARMRGVKGGAWNGGHRALSFWRWGKQFTAGDCPQMTGHVDVFPTLVDLYHLDLPDRLVQQLDGNSLRPLLEDTNAVLDENRMQVHHRGRWNTRADWADHKYTHCCVRWKNYQLLRIEPCDNPDCRTCRKIHQRSEFQTGAFYTMNYEHYRVTERGKWELYDISVDPFQENNLAEHKPEIVRKMASHYESWWKDVSAVFATGSGGGEMSKRTESIPSVPKKF